MTSGFPPDAAVRRRAGALVPPAVSLVFVGTVLLSVVLRGGAGSYWRWACPVPGPLDRTPVSCAPDAGGALSRETPPRRATVSHIQGKTPGATRSGRAVPHRTSPGGLCSPSAGTQPSGRGHAGCRAPANTSPTADRVGRSASRYSE